MEKRKYRYVICLASPPDGCSDVIGSQIWFQNRRQTSRRKSRPLLPHEIAQYQLSRSGIAPEFSSDPAAGSPQGEDTQALANDTDELEHANQIQEILSKEIATSPDDDQALSSPGVAIQAGSMEHGTLGLLVSNETESMERPPPRHLPASIGRVGHISNRRSAPSLRPSVSLGKHISPPTHVQTGSADSALRLRKASPFVRISMNSEGNAKVITKDSSSPSPPHASQGPPPIGHDIGHGAADRAPGIPLMKPLQRSSSGRSRDSRVWEFWCDKDARTELEDKAEKDASGSAANAIGLLRSASGRSILGSIPSKRNSAVSMQGIPSKRSRFEMAMPKLHKSSTALGRLEGKPSLSAAGYGKPNPKLMFSESAFSVYIPGNESDKENWSPSGEVPNHGQSELSQQSEDTSRDTLPKGSARQSAVESLKRQRPSGTIAGSDKDEEDQEVTAFMRGARKSSNISGDEELDCVQGLLSLSQGNWR